ncbi:hypothetical protein [Pantoea phytobeneficialis]|uniref:Uncharacterized protein n=1 Tax=Pantoea phytobeneficialis TaxID=2052056 RepID=A0AAP9HAQ3_9GAMM|nr:hypothetical protein [Pantoea phytobeneficialis]MDO6406537.1 hypothetical protein [Pantoea phytobeneficialis]QGR09634.1 hypothetical protein CTZ24_24520 [Pantoea phytobeneficialis]
MSVSIYYSAKRNSPITTAENVSLLAIADMFNQGFPYKNEGETLSFYRKPSEEYILEGATKLPYCDETIIVESVIYWLKALTHLTSALPTAVWEVQIDDCPASWVDDHWEM